MNRDQTVRAIVGYIFAIVAVISVFRIAIVMFGGFFGSLVGLGLLLGAGWLIQRGAQRRRRYR